MGGGSCSRSTAPRATSAIVPADPRQATYIQVSEFTVPGAQAGKPLTHLPAGLPFNVGALWGECSGGRVDLSDRAGKPSPTKENSPLILKFHLEEPFDLTRAVISPGSAGGGYPAELQPRS